LGLLESSITCLQIEPVYKLLKCVATSMLLQDQIYIYRFPFFSNFLLAQKEESCLERE
jgi:hypothetical protein